MSEAALWTRLLGTPGLYGTRITDRLVGGIPDAVVVVRDSGTTAWVELKTIGAGETVLGLRADQAAFASRWSRAGGLSVILVQRGTAELGVLVPEPGPEWVRRAISADAWYRCLRIDALAAFGPFLDELARSRRGR